MRFSSKKISRRFFAALMLLAVIPILAMGYGVYRAAQEVVISYAYMHIQTIAQDHAHHLEIWFHERLGDVQMLSQLPLVQNLCHVVCGSEMTNDPASPELEPINTILALTRSKSPSYHNVYLLGPSGRLLAAADPHVEEFSLKQGEALFTEVEAAGEPVLGPVHRHTDQRLYMHLAVPVRSPQGNIIALTVAVLDVSATLNPILTDRAGLGKTGEAYLVSQDGHIITESRHLSHAETLDRVFRTVGIEAALAGKQGTGIYANYVGREVIGSYLWLPRYHWALLAEMEKNEILAPIGHIRTTVLVTALIVGLLSLLLALLTSHRVSRPIVWVSEAAREMADGQLDRRITFEASDEVGMLAESFNSMAEKLSQVISSLRQNEASLLKAYDDLLEAQEHLAQSEKMAAIGELVTSVVHEMRNPLSSVKLNLQIIGRTLEKGSLLSEHYQIALDQALQLERMFTDLLNYSKPLTLERTPVRIDALVDDGLRQLDPILRERAVTVAKRFEDGIVLVMVDPDKMRQVLVNVIKNAVEASEQGGRVEIAAQLGGSNGKPGLDVTVSDHGKGIPAQDLSRVFQPFFTTRKKGTGLGLSIVKKIVEAHGFTIQLSSEEGRGTVVHLHLQGIRDEENPHR